MQLLFRCFLFCLSLWANTQSMFLDVQRRSIIGEAKLHCGWVGTTSAEGVQVVGNCLKFKICFKLGLTVQVQD